MTLPPVRRRRRAPRDEKLVHLSLRDAPIQAKLEVGRVDHGAELEFSILRDKLRLVPAETGERVRDF